MRKIIDWLEERYLIIFIIAFFTVIPILICCFFISKEKNYYYETSPIIYEVTDKDTDRIVFYHRINNRMVPTYNTHYYLICEDNKIEVSYEVYSEYNTGDKIVLTKKTKYLTENNSIVNISYEFNN